MPDVWMPGLRHDPGNGADYEAGTNAMQFVVHHDTGGTNSYQICKDGRPGYDTGLCQILLPKVGVPWQFVPINAVSYHCGSSEDYDHDSDADNYNRTGPGLEVERRPGEPLSADQVHWLHEIGLWLAEWGIPDVQYRGAPLTDADNFRGHVNHRDLHPNPDGLSVAEWDLIHQAGEPEPEIHGFDDMVFVQDDNGVKTYYIKAKGLVKISDAMAYELVVVGKAPTAKVGGWLGALDFDAKLRADYAK